MPSREHEAPLLETVGVVKRFGGQTALGGVSLRLHAGEVVALAGENGAGKSTFVGVCSGALSPDEGEVRWQGGAVRFSGTAAARAAGIAVVHQEPQLVPTLPVAENLLLGRLPRRARVFVDHAVLYGEAARALDRIGLDVPLHALVGTLSAAARQLVAIARAVHEGARLLILDEPTSSLSTEDAARLGALVRELSARGTAVIYISHRFEELASLAHRVVVLRDGRVTLDAPMAAVSRGALLEALSGRELLAEDARHGSVTASTQPPLLTVTGVERRGRLRNIHLLVNHGECVGIAGLVGSGRSRLLHTIFGSERRDAGEIVVHARDARHPIHRMHDALGAGIGLVPEDRHKQGLVLAAPIADNVALAVPPEALIAGFLRRARIVQFASRVIATLRIRARGPSQPVRELSGGNQQKVLLGRWLRPGTRLLLLDEPTRGVDVVAKAEIHHHLRRLTADGVAVLMASSDIPELLAVCDRIYVMRGGAIVGELRAAGADAARIVALATGNVAA